MDGGATLPRHLADAVHAYARHGFSIAQSAEVLHIHPNRLDRWQKRTGWDPRTYDGLVRSMASIDLSEPVQA